MLTNERMQLLVIWTCPIWRLSSDKLKEDHAKRVGVNSIGQMLTSPIVLRHVTWGSNQIAYRDIRKEI